MADFYIHGSATQGTSSPTTNPLLYPLNNPYQGTSQACIVDLTPPAFSGISTLTLQPLGQIRAQWGLATDASAPIKYEVYIKQGDAVNLFYAANIVAITDKLQFDVFTLPNGVLLSAGVTYYLGVKAVDATGNRDNNLVSMNILSSGISASGSSEYEVAGIFNIDVDGDLIGTLWATINDEIVTDLGRLGTASYVIYDKNGLLVSGMSESGIVASANGQFNITPVLSTLDLIGNFYTVKATIVVDSLARNNYLPISGTSETAGGTVFEPRAAFSISASNQLDGTIWVTQDGQQVNAALGTASLTIYDKTGATIGITQSGLTADVNGFYHITPVSASPIIDLTHFVVKLTVVVDSSTKTGVVAITLGE